MNVTPPTTPMEEIPIEERVPRLNRYRVPCSEATYTTPEKSVPTTTPGAPVKETRNPMNNTVGSVAAKKLEF
jgi:hypothetical protein